MEVVDAKGVVERPGGRGRGRCATCSRRERYRLKCPPRGASSPVVVTIYELNGSMRVNGFTIAANPAPAGAVRKANAALERTVFEPWRTRSPSTSRRCARGRCRARRRRGPRRGRGASPSRAGVTVDVTVRIKRGDDAAEDKGRDRAAPRRHRRDGAHPHEYAPTLSVLIRSHASSTASRGRCEHACRTRDAAAQARRLHDDAAESARRPCRRAAERPVADRPRRRLSTAERARRRGGDFAPVARVRRAGRGPHCRGQRLRRPAGGARARARAVRGRARGLGHRAPRAGPRHRSREGHPVTAKGAP